MASTVVSPRTRRGSSVSSLTNRRDSTDSMGNQTELEPFEAGPCTVDDCDCSLFKAQAFKRNKCQECFHVHQNVAPTPTLTSPTSSVASESALLSPGGSLAAKIAALDVHDDPVAERQSLQNPAGRADGGCKHSLSCMEQPFKEGMCVDHYRLASKSKVSNHKYLNNSGKKRQQNAKMYEDINKKFLNSSAYDELTADQLATYQKQFEDMDEDGSGDVDIVELGRAMEKLGKPKNQLELRKMIAEVDHENKGTIDYEAYLTMMCGKASSVLRIILKFEKLAQPKDQKPKGRPPQINLYK